MVRKQIYIRPEQEEMLKRRSKELGISEAALIRRGIEQVSQTEPSLPPDLQAWEEEQEFIRERMKMIVPQTGRSWTREELYEDRFERYTR
jgi:hypothetical protein